MVLKGISWEIKLKYESYREHFLAFLKCDIYNNQSLNSLPIHEINMLLKMCIYKGILRKLLPVREKSICFIIYFQIITIIVHWEVNAEKINQLINFFPNLKHWSYKEK